MMQPDLFLYHLREFVSKHGISSEIDSRLRKLKAEVQELDESIMEGNPVEIVKEACDVAIIAFHIMTIYGVNNPLFDMFLKLQEVSERPHYKMMAENIRKGGI